MPRSGLTSDAALASRVRHGDRRALKTLYGRYAGEIFDFAVPVTGPPGAAAVVADTFTTAWDRIRVGVKPPRVEPWLLGIAYAAALARTTGRVTWPAEAGPDEGAAASTARRWAETLTPRQYALVDLYMRRGLSVKELAAITGIAQQSVQARLDRLAADLEQFAACELILHRPVSCTALTVLLERIRGADDADVRRSVRQHARLCEACGGAAQRARSSLSAFAELPVPRWHGDATWAAVAAHAGGQVARGAPPATTASRGAGPRRLLTVAAAGVCVAGAVLVVALNPFDDGVRDVPSPSAEGVEPLIGSPQSAFEPPRKQAAPEPSPPPRQGKTGAGSGGEPAKTPKPKPQAAQGDKPQAQSASPPAKPSPAAPAETTPAEPRAGTAPPKPSPAAPPPRARTLAWAPVNGAVGYELILQRDGKEVFKTRTRDSRAVLPTTWTHGGRAVKLQTGYYRWIVWPLEAGQRKGEQAVVVSNLHID